MATEQFFKDIENQFKKSLPFVIYRKPNEDLLKALFQKNDLVYNADDIEEAGFVFAPFDDHGKTILIPYNESRIIEIVHKRLDEVDTPSFDNSREKAGKQNFVSLVEHALDHLSSSVLDKIVLSRREKVHIQDHSPVRIFKRLLYKYPEAFVYCWYHPKVGLWLGATPEILLRIDNNKLTTMALAGTINYEGSLNVSWGEKELREQQIVTEYITTALEPLVENMNKSQVRTVRAGGLLHLQTMINADLKQGSNNIKGVVKTLHPTPAVCGMPTGDARQYILSHEPHDREYYTGYLGELAADRVELFVNLRCMQIQEAVAILYIGGGITMESVPEKEWEETVNKAITMKSIL
jgi:isochorismate synthase